VCVLPRPYYALHRCARWDYAVPMELAKALRGAKSEFNPTVSACGGAGLMQLIARTAAERCRDLGLTP